MRVVYLTYGDLLGNVFHSQLAPLWRGLLSQGIDLRVFSFQSPRTFFPGDLRRRLRGRVSPFGGRVGLSYIGAGYPPRWPKGIRKRIERLIAAEKPDVLHARGPIAGGLAARALEHFHGGNRPRLVYDARGDTLAELRLGELGVGDVERAVNDVFEFEQAALSAAYRVLAVSAPLVGMLRDHYGFTGDPSVVPCWVEKPENWRDPTELERLTTRRDLGIPPEDWVWGYAGSAAHWQSISEMIRLVARLHEADRRHRILFITGEGSELRRKCRKHGLPEEAVDLRTGSREEALRWLAVCDAALLLREENAINRVACPMKLGDYLLAGVPVLASAGIGDVSGWVRDWGAGSLASSLELDVLEKSAYELIAMIQRMGREEIRAKGRLLYRQKLDLGLYLPMYRSVYEGRMA